MTSTEILLVEDNAGDAALLMDALELSGWAHRLVWLKDGAAALDHLLQQGDCTGASRPDLVILDLNLPRVSGFEVVEAMRQARALEALPIVVLSGSDLGRAPSPGLGLPSDQYFLKPATFQGYQELVGRMEGLFRRLAGPGARAPGAQEP